MDILEHVITPSLYCVLAVVGMAGNGLVLYIMTIVVKTKSVTDVYVTNLAVADFLFVATLPFWANELFTGNWIFGDALCKIISAISYINMYASIFFLTAMAFDRWLAVVQAVKSRKTRTVKRAWINTGIVWIVCLFFALFPLVFRQSRTVPDTDRNRCGWGFPAGFQLQLNITYILMRTLAGFLIPLCVVIFCYANIITFMRRRSKMKGKKFKGLDKVTKMVTAIIVCFILAWLPNQVTNMVHLLNFAGIYEFCSIPPTIPSPMTHWSASNMTGATAQPLLQGSNFSTDHGLLNTPSTEVVRIASDEGNLSIFLETTYAGSNQTGSVTASNYASAITHLQHLNPISDATTFNPMTPNVTTTISDFASSTWEMTTQEPPSRACYRRVKQIHWITVCLGFANSVMNPFVYAFVGSALRKKLKVAFKCCRPKRLMRRRSFGPLSMFRSTRTTGFHSEGQFGKPATSKLMCTKSHDHDENCKNGRITRESSPTNNNLSKVGVGCTDSTDLTPARAASAGNIYRTSVMHERYGDVRKLSTKSDCIQHCDTRANLLTPDPPERKVAVSFREPKGEYLEDSPSVECQEGHLVALDLDSDEARYGGVWVG